MSSRLRKPFPWVVSNRDSICRALTFWKNSLRGWNNLHRIDLRLSLNFSTVFVQTSHVLHRLGKHGSQLPRTATPLARCPTDPPPGPSKQKTSGGIHSNVCPAREAHYGRQHIRDGNQSARILKHRRYLLHGLPLPAAPARPRMSTTGSNLGDHALPCSTPLLSVRRQI